jgi:hypothetical protein
MKNESHIQKNPMVGEGSFGFIQEISKETNKNKNKTWAPLYSMPRHCSNQGTQIACLHFKISLCKCVK